MKKLKKILRHNQFLAFTMLIALVAGTFLFGCESTVTSPFDPTHKVTRAELRIEVDAYLAKVDLAVMDLDKQDAVRQKLAEIGIVLAQGGTVNPIGAGLGILSILGVGAVADNRKKDSIIKTLQNSSPTA